ncbi:aminoacyl-tRNA hydrolase [Patescibacteria group bacterium]|nr:aminoacyl-tRNA hydrolase [Patescibacteria group bacterium]MBU1256140.1 aminoacyl-tRNA hydrolase [Patescibacteria group bacterium]MBU1457128.1 aminoacyl-tRNA hydrolase [Patescibacteria group bacterium]
MKLVVGLGNIGEKYKGTRHNVGFMVVDGLIGEEKWNKNKNYMDSRLRGNDGGEDVVLVKPTTFMNESGRAVAKMVRFYKIDLDNLYVVHDDLDLKLGEYKIQKGVGPKVHNGILSVEKELGDKEFWRVRVGIDNRGRKITQSEQFRSKSKTVPMSDFSGADYVLGRFGKEENEILDGVLGRVVKEIKEKICI